MKIGFDITSLQNNSPPIDGMANYLFRTIQLLLEHTPYDIYTFGLYPSKEVFVTPRHTFIDLSEYFTTSNLTYEQYYYFLNFLLPTMLEKYSIDIFHGTDNFNIPLEKTSTRYVLTIHDIILIKREHLRTSERSFFFYKHYTERAFELADSIITVSNHSLNDIKSYFKQEHRNLHVIYPPLNLPKTVITKHNTTNGYFLSSGGVSERKNLNTLIKAFYKSGLYLYGVSLIITGHYQVEEVQYKTLSGLIHTYGIEDYVRFTGLISRDEFIQYLRNALCVITLSYAEGFGLSAAEAITLGIPVIAANTASLPEVVGKAGILVNPDDFSEVASQMTNIYKNKQLKKSLKEKSKQQAKKYTNDQFMHSLRSLYEVLARSKTVK